MQHCQRPYHRLKQYSIFEYTELRVHDPERPEGIDNCTNDEATLFKKFFCDRSITNMEFATEEQALAKRNSCEM